MPWAAWLFALTINSVSPTVINSSEDSVTVTASYSGSTTAQQYLQVAMTKEGISPSKYFGLTQNLDSGWYQYKSSPTLSDLTGYFFKFTPQSASWSGQLVAKMDINSEGYKGPGNYILKLFRHITAGGIESDNTVSLTINVATISAVTATPTPQPTTAVSPNLTIDLASSANLGETFKVGATFKNFEAEKEYFLKLRGGLDESHLTKLQTKNGSNYFSDNESWDMFPTVKTDSSGNWSGDIWGLLGEDKDDGNYKIKLRVRKKDTETFFESDLKDLKFIKPVVITATPTPIATKSAVKQIKPEVLAANVEVATPEATIFLTVTPTPAPKKDFFVLAIVGAGLIATSIIMGLFLNK